MESCLQVQKELPYNATSQHWTWQCIQFYLKEESSKISEYLKQTKSTQHVFQQINFFSLFSMAE